MKKIVLTGGGTAGHVTPNLALVPHLKSLNYDIHYMGSYKGIERKLVEDFKIPYYPIATGKFRRYFDLKNFTDPFRVLKGYQEARQILQEIKPDIVFSKGGFVSVPIVRAAASLKIPCIIHESDMTPGLANRLCIPVAQKICCNFHETIDHIASDKAIVTGTPIRAELLTGNKIAALDFCNFTANKPVIMVIGGSQGSTNINKIVRESLTELLESFQVVHLCGKDKIDNLLLNVEGYTQFEYIKTELKDILALADLVISRAGANTICELLALRKPNILIPLPSKSSRGDQILNAKSFEKQGYSSVLDEDDLTSKLLVETVKSVYANRNAVITTMNSNSVTDSIQDIIALIEAEVLQG